MTVPGSVDHERLGSWDRFWFAPQSFRPVAVVRIAAGALWLSYLISLSFSTREWLHPTQAVLPSATVREAMYGTAWTSSPFDFLNSAGGITALHVVAIAIAVSYICGLGGRIVALLTWASYLAYVHRLPITANIAEPFLGMFLAYSCLAPGSSAIGVDRWIRSKRGMAIAEAGWSARLAQRLMQVHFVGLLLMTVTNRLAGVPWWSGEAVWWLMTRTESRLVDLTSLHRPPAFLGVNLWTHSVIAVEFLAAVGLWHARLNLFAAAGVVLISTSLVLLTGELPWAAAMAIGVVPFLPPSWIESGRRQTA